MNKIIWASLLWAFASAAYTQTITLIDEETGDPVPFATLSSEGPEASAITDAQGRVDMTAFQGAEEITVSSVGYKTLIISYKQVQSAGEVRLKPSKLSLDEVVVSATRWRQTSGNIPSKIISVSPKEVALQNPQTAADLLGVSGKVFIQKSQQGGGSPMIRGFATNRLVYTIDGVRMNTAIFRGGNLQNVISLDPFATENTEVLFGPGSVIYGSDAIGGVMSFQTLTPRFSQKDKPRVEGKAVARYASASNEKTGHADINIGWQKWALVTSISAWDYDHLRQGRHGPDDYLKKFHVRRIDNTDVVVQQDDPLLQIPSAYAQLNLMQKVRYQPSRDWDIQYGFHFSETSEYGRYDRHNRMRDGNPRYGKWNYGPQKWRMNHLNIRHQAGTSLYDQLTLRLAQQSFEESRIDRNFNSTMERSRVEETNAYSVNLDLVKQLGAKHTLYYGVEYVNNDVMSTGTQTDITTGETTKAADRYPASTWQSIAAYLNDEFKINPDLTLQGGIRYNHFLLDADFSDNQDFYPLPFTNARINNGSFTGSIGGVYRPDATWALKVNFGTAFRSPNVDDIGKVFDSEPGSVVVPNPDLSAEYAYNVDMGVAKVFGESVKIDLTGYYTRLNKAMVRRNFQLNGRDSILYDGINSNVLAIQNAAVANVYGLQAGVEVMLPAGLSFSSDLNYQVGEEELDDGSTSPSRHAAPLFGVSRITYRTDRLRLQVYATYQGQRLHSDLSVSERSKEEIYALDENGNTYAPGWYTLNMKAQIQLNDLLNLSTGIENLTDQRYRPYSSGISGPGRNFIISLQAKF